ncbi:MAG: CDP-diacylglycerol--serine O-phosphatidyltransferase [Candidatus Glassbacteria bacterium]
MRLRRTRLVLPSAFTAGNLFFGLFAMVSAFRGELRFASYLIIIGGVLDFIDGKVARISKTHTQFGAELDSLADIVTFGVAPAVIIYYFLLIEKGEWSWLLMFFFVLAGALRLARFNVEKAGPEKKLFTGLPIPVAGGVLASFIPFYQTGIPDVFMRGVGYGKFVAVLMALLSILMVSHVRYQTFPRINIKTLKGIVLLILIVGVISSMIIFPEYTIFPLGLIYIGWGLLKEVFGGFVEEPPVKAEPTRERPVVLERKKNGKESSSL